MTIRLMVVSLVILGGILLSPLARSSRRTSTGSQLAEIAETALISAAQDPIEPSTFPKSTGAAASGSGDPSHSASVG